MEAVAEATPLQLSVQWRRSRSARTSFRTTDRYNEEQIFPLASLEALWLAPEPA